MIDLLAGLRGDRHPMHSADAARQIISLLPATDMSRALAEVSRWLRSVGESPDFKPRVRQEVVGLLDEAGRLPEQALLAGYFKDPRLRNVRGRLVWSGVYEYWSALADGYLRCALEDMPKYAVGEAGRAQLGVLAARALRARASQLRLALLHYEPVPAQLWSNLYALLARCEQAGILGAAVRAYPGERTHTTPLQELMTALLVAVAAPERLPPEEIEAAFRIARRFAGAGRIEAAPFEGATHVLRLDGGAPPARMAAGAAREPQLRYFGAGEALARLERMIGHHELSMLDEDERIAKDYSPGQKVTVLRQFIGYWGPHPPQPERKLIRLEGGLAVVHGFDAVCHYVPHAATAAAARQAAKPGEKPIEVAEEEELATPESWPERDAGLHTVHARAGKGTGAWAEVGDLAAIRIHDRSDWWLAAIRRLALAEEGALDAEFEVLSRKPFSVWLRVLGLKDRMASNWETSGSFAFDYVHAIVLSDRAAPGHAPSVIVPKGKFVPGQLLELMHGERSRNVRFTEFLEQGKDFDWCGIEWEPGAV
ncbi:MAG TPA: hypothetical protein VMT02_08325 [Burkholderiales bacterium]|nr:hypothetical protein [Burkholderiales bacterium]